MKRTWIAVLIFVIYLALVVVTALLIHMTGMRLALFCIVLGLLGLAALLFFLWYQKKYMAPPGSPSADKTELANLEAILRDADLKLRQAARAGGKSLRKMPLIYLIGDENSAKTQTVLQSGLEPELLAGQLYRDQIIVPTQVVNIWLAGQSLIVEAGGSLLRQAGLWIRLLKLSQPSNVGGAFANSSKRPTRAVVVCVSIERILAPNTSEQIRALAVMLNERLRQLSQTLGISLPVYVLLTKIDRVPSFADYAARLTPEEVRAPLGSVLAPQGIGAGLYAERATQEIGIRFDELIHSLSEFRLEVLSRGGEPDALARAYEFPRDLRKLRSGIVDFLVEIARPSQLGVNPFLRGFFLTGMRAHFVEDVLGVASAPVAPAPVQDANATRIFSFAQQTPMRAAAPVRGGTRKVPQWVFLPHLFSNILLADKTALESSRASTKVNFVKRLLLGLTCLAIFTYLVLATVSYFNNADLEHRVAVASQASAPLVQRGNLPLQRDLQSLDQLRALVAELDGYHHDGPPTMYRWGLNNNDALYAAACHAYGQHFNRLLLSATQANMLAKLRAVKSPPTADVSYNDTYKPLKAYLITTSNPDKSTLDFLPAVLDSEWAGTLNPSFELNALAQSQFTQYSTLLAEPGSCLATAGGAPDNDVVAHAREYLSHFQGSQHIYQSMVTAANHKFPSIIYNDTFKGSEHYIVDRYAVAGAYTKVGFPFMQDAIKHPEPYYRGEEWVLGPPSANPSGSNVDLTTLPADLQKLYVADYRTAWRTYLNSAHFIGYQNWHDAGERLGSLDSNVSPMLELFSLISYNTGVASPDIASAFQAPQAVIPAATANTQFIANTNQAYIQALQGLELAVKGLTQNQLTANDPAAAQPVIQAANTADMATGTLRNSFTPDAEGKMDTVSFNLLSAPIKSASALAAAAPAAAAGGGAKTFCALAAPTLAKFPFNPQATDEATPEEVAAIFQPGPQSALGKLAEGLKALIAPQGGTYVAAPGSAIPVSRTFLNFFNTAEKFSTTLYPAGGTQAGLEFTLMEVKDPASPPATLSIDGESLSTAGQAVPFHWKSQKTSTFMLKSTQTVSNTGPWSVFHFGYYAIHPSTNRLEYHFEVNGQNKQTVQFDATGPGAALLDPHFMAQLHCVASVAK